MPLGRVLGEYVLKATSTKVEELGGGHVRLEINYAGEGTGEVPGHNIGTLSFIAEGGDPSLPAEWKYLGALLTTSGSVVKVSGSGVRIRTGDGHKARYRGSVRYYTTDPKLSDFNKIIAATESEGDPATMTLKGAVCEWK
jgi:hypothetical protein